MVTSGIVIYITDMANEY